MTGSAKQSIGPQSKMDCFVALLLAMTGRECRAVHSPSSTSGEGETLPCPERGGAEQRFLRRGLRAPILRRRKDLSAEFGRRMPAPARVVEHGPRERDHVGLAGGHDLLSLSGFGDQADRYGGHARHLLD